MNIEGFRRQLDQASKRYASRTKERERQKKQIKDGVAADSPDRVFRRLASLGRTELFAEEDVARGSVGLERIIGEESELLNADFVTQAFIVARSTGRVVIRSGSGSTMGYGTGFLVSDRLLMTNNHVLESSSVAGRSVVQFEYVERFGGSAPTPVEFALQPGVFFRTSVALDFSLVAVEPVNAAGHRLDRRGWSPLIRESGKTLIGEPVNIVQHPGGRPQQVALRSNPIVDVVEDFLHYAADAEQGSSGSGVFNDQWELSALHHAGVPDKDGAGRILLTDGTVWNGSAGDRDRIHWVANEGVRISRIVAHLMSLSLSEAQRELLERAFAPRPRIEALLGSDAPAVERGGASARPVGVVESGGRATWTIPLRVSVDLGSLGGGGMAGIAAGIAAGAAGGASGVGGGAAARSVKVASPVDDTRLSEAMRRLEDFSQRPYYDEDADNEAVDAYYAGLDEEPTPRKMFEQLHELLRRTHTHDPDYSSARLDHLYPWVDLWEVEGGRRELRSVYSGKAMDAREVIRAELEIEARREAARRELLASESFASEDEMLERLEEIESSLPYNCEHVVCQSWFDKKRPMKTDLHHLFACDSGCNSFRGNIPYFQFAPEDEAFRAECGQREGDKFEPVAGKGAVARATLYFLLRYPRAIGDRAGELSADRLEVLLGWHRAEEPSWWEYHRNQAIHEIQGNRNPLIDWPEWAAQADFARGLP